MLHSALSEKLLTYVRHWACKSARKRFSTVSFVAIMVIGTFAFAGNLFFSTAKATYVEGAITQNTVWMLVDSPFEVMQNVTVYPSVTLTIEPGVEVRFGGDFSIIVNGHLVANGTQNGMITFTSNKYQPAAGDWGTIDFNGTQPSLLTYSSVKYATNGITAEHGNLEVRNSVISNNAQYGIFVANSTALIQDDEITSNSISGICTCGNVTNSVTILNNTISSNADGILLYGTNSSGVTISNNIVLSNNQSGIQLNANAYKNLAILHNNISANDMGFYISGLANQTYIANNSISYNSIGLLYSGGQDHQAHWNDIYNNSMGMDVSSDAPGMIVNATYNYWGDPSGPYHASLNPSGKGNPVGGDGLNLIFIFFLTKRFDYQPPIARLLADKKTVLPNQPVTFFATLSSDDGRVDQYFFNFGDGENSSWTTLSVFVHSYSSVGTYNATLQVKDDFGVPSNNLANWTIACQIQPPLTVSLISNSLVINSTRQASIAVQVTNADFPMDYANVILFSIWNGSLWVSSGQTNSSGYFTTTFYAPSVTAITNIRIEAWASKTGYADGSDFEDLLIQPPLMVNVASPSIIKSEATAEISVRVTYSGEPVSGAVIALSSNSTEGFSQTIGITDANGTYTTDFTAPQTLTQIGINITATAMKKGYLSGQEETLLTIEPIITSSAVTITKDTLWTLVDSPIIIGKDVIVYPNATLTVEPGVEVRFGGDFSLIVNGQLVAEGTQDKKICFTSNKETPQPGDWNGIIISSTRTTQLTYCLVEYAQVGMSITNGIVEVKNSLVSNNYQDGMLVENSLATIESNEITNNTQSGVSITGSNIATIQNNTISSNGDGMLLSGNVSSVSITKNIVLLNTQSGIHLNANAYYDVIIRNNILSANYNGFLVDGLASTYITNNSVSYNTVGFSYENSQNNVAHWNDIYGNEMGMNALSDATVNATYNYWGDQTGPYHASLNPSGKGNAVGGDGINLNFISFLTVPVGSINKRPVARLLVDMTHVLPGQQVTFFATNSTDDRRVEQYFFDFGDAKNSGWTTLSVFIHKYSSVGTYNATVKVMDDFGVVSNNLANWTITCQLLPPLTASLIPSNPVIGSGGQVSVVVQVTNGTSSVDNASVTLFSILGGNFLSSSGWTDLSGHFATTFYAPNVTAITPIRIEASASKAGYVDGSDYEYLLVQPPLIVNVATNPERINSEATTNVTINVTSDGVPVSGVDITVSSNSTGRFDQRVGITDANGTCTFVFTASEVALITNIKIVALASKTGFVDCSGYEYLLVQPPLTASVTSNPNIIKSEATASVSVRVMYSDEPLSGASVTILSNSSGGFDRTIGVTDANGTCTFVFTAPQTSTQIGVNIIATATEGGYLSGQGQALLTIEPKVLLVQISPSSALINSEMSSNVTVRVVYGVSPVSNATVIISSLSSVSGGSFSRTNATTDANGECRFVFTAPQITTPTNVTIIANATKTGYAQGANQTMIEVNLGALSVQVSANPVWIDSRATSRVTVHVTHNDHSVADVAISMSCGGIGTFALPTGNTNATGYCVFTFTAAETSIEFSQAITANATKNGYLDGQGRVWITVSPVSHSWLSLPVIIAMLAMILVIVVALILIKLKIIVISSRGE